MAVEVQNKRVSAAPDATGVQDLSNATGPSRLAVLGRLVPALALCLPLAACQTADKVKTPNLGGHNRPYQPPRPPPVRDPAQEQRNIEKSAAMGIAARNGIESGVFISSDGKPSSFAKMAGMEIIDYKGGGSTWTASVYHKGQVIEIDFNAFSRWTDNAPKKIEALLKGERAPVVLGLDGSVFHGQSGVKLGEIDPIPEAGRRSFTGASNRLYVSSPDALTSEMRSRVRSTFGDDVTWSPQVQR